MAQACGNGTGTGKARVVRLHADSGQRIYSWMVARKGAKPLLPHPETNDPNETLLFAEIAFEDPEVHDGAAALVFMVAGTYVYALAEPRLHKNTLRVPVSPYLNLGPGSVTYTE